MGNVRATVQKESNGSLKLVSAADYYPFGMLMPNKATTPGEYRFGYQGQFSEKDEETGYNQFELRLWDGRLGRWLTTDPAGQYASPYLGMGNSPVNRIDPDGGLDDDVYYNSKTGDSYIVETGKHYDRLFIDGEFVSYHHKGWGQTFFGGGDVFSGYDELNLTRSMHQAQKRFAQLAWENPSLQMMFAMTGVAELGVLGARGVAYFAAKSSKSLAKNSMQALTKAEMAAVRGAGSSKDLFFKTSRQALRQAKRDLGIPTSQTHITHIKNVRTDRLGGLGSDLIFDGGKTVQWHKTGHLFPTNPKPPHFNIHPVSKLHYIYGR
jgi:RHS repeat-associated protein